MGGWCALAAMLLSAQPAIRLSAQVAPNRATSYLHPTDVHDARALWVNPAGLAVLREASVYAELLVDEPGERGRLRQVNAGFNSRGLSFGYQRDVFDAGVRGHTYRLGLAGSAEGLAGGFAVAYYRGAGASATGWDIGVTYQWISGLRLGAVIANLGQPEVRGVRQRLTYIPGATWYPAPLPAVGLSAHARFTPDAVVAYAFGVNWQGSGKLPLAIIARLDTDGSLRRGAFAFGLSFGRQDRLGLVASTPGNADGIDAASLYGLAARQPTRRR